MNSNLNFKKTRDFGEVLSDTFKFIRENFKHFFTTILKIVSPFLIALILTNAYYTFTSVSFATSGANALEIISSSGESFTALSLNVLTVVVYIIAIWVVVFQYIQSYIKNNGVVNTEEVSAGLKRNLGKGIALQILVGITCFVAIFFMIIPAFYLGVVLTLALPILVFENKGISESFTDAFSLIKNNWWFTFGLLFVFGLIVSFATAIFQMPLIIYTAIKTIVGADSDPSTIVNMAQQKDYVLIILSILSSIIQYIFYAFTPVLVAVIYFSLNEEKNATGTFENIENLGKDN
ncbi:glycerophosphoryl diester phosphodiesterase membrane domain-containing protein [Zunongwangia sp.]|uniref:glycerophosphoryl diester phosphodiesterase membrane domain-containing protein n=1 Tax=Zunongwangia sp. TaxID=1965325 RepID=UPI003AA7AD79